MSAPSNPFATSPAGIDPAIVRSIRQASQSSSADFGLLMAQAEQESSFQPGAKASTSSATGLYQFIDSTWLDMVRQFGQKYGIGTLAQQVTVDDSGKSAVADKTVRKQILDLRKDPQLSAALAGEYTQLNKSEIERGLGHTVSRAALYMAHFLGAGGATTFLKAVESKGATVAADLLPDAAAANRNIFYDGQTGQAKTVAQIYHSLANRIEHEAMELAGAMGVAATDGDIATSGLMKPATSTLAADAIASVPIASVPIASVPIATSPATEANGETAAIALGAASFHAVGGASLSGGRLSEPLLAMLNVMSLAALKLIDQPEHTAAAGAEKAGTGKSKTPNLQASLRPHRSIV